MSAEPKQTFLAALEKAHGSRLRRYLAARMRSAAPDIQDLTQEVYLRLLRIDNHETIRNPQAYLFTIASHVLHQYALRRAAQPTTIEIADEAFEPQDLADTDPATQIEIEQRYEKLGQALEQLSPRAYATLLMHRRDGIPLEEIAAQFGVSYSMVKKYLAKALTYCQEQLQEKE